ncbi:MAG: endonuclease domain-containing protein [Actinomycetota bacterium]
MNAEVLEEALDDALRRGLTTMARLRWRFAALRRQGRPGIGAVDRLLRERIGITQSVLETRVLRLIKRARLPDPVCQHEVRNRRGRLVAVVDFAYPDRRLAIEADGYRWHSGRARWEHDRSRSNALMHLGWRVIHVTARDLEQRPRETARSIREAYATPAQAIEPSRNHPE